MRGHVERFVCLDQIDVVRKAPATRDHDVALFADRKRVTLQIVLAGSSMGETPVAAENVHGAVVFINHRVDAKSRRNQLRNALTLLMHSISIQHSWADTRLAAAALKIKRQHVRGFDRFRRRQPGTDRLASTSESREVMKVDP